MLLYLLMVFRSLAAMGPLHDSIGCIKSPLVVFAHTDEQSHRSSRALVVYPWGPIPILTVTRSNP